MKHKSGVRIISRPGAESLETLRNSTREQHMHFLCMGGRRKRLSTRGTNWSVSCPGLASILALPILTTHHSNYARDYAMDRFRTFGLLSRVDQQQRSPQASLVRPRITNEAEERLLDRIDPAHQLDRLSN